MILTAHDPGLRVLPSGIPAFSIFRVSSSPEAAILDQKLQESTDLMAKFQPSLADHASRHYNYGSSGAYSRYLSDFIPYISDPFYVKSMFS